MGIKRAVFKKVVLTLIMTVAVAHHATAESLYEPDRYRSLAADYKAMSVGDNVTVLIVENSKASSSTESNSNQALNASAGIGLTNHSESGSIDASLGRGSGGGTGRAGQLNAQISAVIQEVDQNGRLFVTGEQTIVINGEEQIIGVSGWMRPTDIMPNNRIYSSRLSNARIEYRGEGVISDGEKRGVIHWFLDKIGLI